MEAVYFTLVAALLYLLSDFILERAERHAGRRFEYRSLIFFGILLALALVSFAVLGRYQGLS